MRSYIRIRQVLIGDMAEVKAICFIIGYLVAMQTHVTVMFFLFGGLLA